MNRREWLRAAAGFVATGSGLGAVGCGRPAEVAATVGTVRPFSLPPQGASLPAPRSMNVDAEGRVIVLDDAGRVLRFHADGEFEHGWNMPESEVGNPEGVCVFRDGRIAVADTHYHRVVIFDAQGTVLEIFGKEGHGPGEFDWPVAVGQDPDGNFYVAEYGGDNRVQKFAENGRYLTTWGGQGTGAGQFQRPSGLVWLDGHVFVADAFNNRVQVFSDNGEFLRMFGEFENASGLSYPYDIALGRGDDLFIIEYQGCRVTRTDLSGRLLGRFGRPGSDDGQFHTPWGLTVTAERHVWVADTGNRRVVDVEWLD